MIDELFIQNFLNKRTQYKPDEKNVKSAHSMRIHADGEFPSELLDERRPNESDTIKEYRKKIFKSMTKAPFDKILNTLMRMRRAEDWKISYPVSPKVITEEETLQEYCEENFPKFNSVTEWMFQYGLKEMMIDPNAALVIMPLSIPKPNEYVKPFILLFKSKQILSYVEEESAILLSSVRSKYLDNKTEREGDIFYFLDENSIWQSTQIGNNKFETVILYTHNIGYIPCVKLGGIIKDINEKGITYASFLSGVLPYWDEAVREYSDLQAEVVQHIHSEKWQWAGQDCTPCSGRGKILKDGKDVICADCNGKGTAKITPYSVMEIKGANENLGEKNAPIPPAGYIQKQIDIVKIQDERIQNHINRGYSAINFDFLAQTPLNQSGTAKELDRQELNSFIYNVSTHVIKTMKDIIYFINEYRYSQVIQSKVSREELLPEIAIPQKFDVLSESYIIDEISKATTSKVSPVVINQLQVEYVAKKFSNDPEMKAMLADILDLNPLPAMSADDKIMAFNNKWVKKEDCILSDNITQFVTTLYEDKGFKTLPRQQKLKKLYAMATAIDKINSPKESVLNSVGGSSVDDEILLKEAEAKANLKGTVGGVNGILLIQQSVAQGTTDLESAVALLVNIYGYDDATARSMIGTPKPQPAPSQQFNRF